MYLSIKRGSISWKKYIALTASAFLLTACHSSTLEGGDNSLQETKISKVSSYSIPNSIQEQISSNQEVIVVTEFYSGGSFSYKTTSKEIGDFIQEASKSFFEKGYKLVASDTNSMGEYGSSISITLIFHKNP